MADFGKFGTPVQPDDFGKFGTPVTPRAERGFVEQAADVGRGMLSYFQNALLSGAQRTSPYPQNYMRAPESEQQFFLETGIPRNQQTQAVLQDPESGQMTVYMRSEETERGPVASAAYGLGAPLMYGLTAGASPGQIARMPAVPTAQAAQRQGLPVTVGQATESPALQMFEETSRATFPGQPLRTQAEALTSGIETGVEGTAARLGATQGRAEGGEAVVRGLSGEGAPAGRGFIPLTSKRGGDLFRKVDSAIGAETPVEIESLRNAVLGTTQRYAGYPEFAAFLERPEFARLKGAFQDTPVPGLPGVVTPGRSAVPYEVLKEFRTQIGRRAEFDMPKGMQTSQGQPYRELYAALSDDMRGAAEAAGPAAVRALDRANRFWSRRSQMIDETLSPFLNLRKSDEAKLTALMNLGKGSGQQANLKALQEVRAALKVGGEWDNTVAAIIRQLGVGNDGEFTVQQFAQNYRKMAPRARGLFFDSRTRQALDDFATVAEQVQRSAGRRNFPNTANRFLDALGLAIPGGIALSGSPGMAAAAGATMIGGNYGFARAMTNPRFVKWLSGTMRSRSPGALENRIALLRQTGVDPAIAEGVAQAARQAWGQVAPEQNPQPMR